MADDKTTTLRAPKRVSPTVAKQFAGGRDVTTFQPARTGYEMKTIFSCRRCAERGHPGLSPREFQSLETGFTGDGLQVWCKRCESEVLAVDFGGQELRKAGPNRVHSGPPTVARSFSASATPAAARTAAGARLMPNRQQRRDARAQARQKSALANTALQDAASGAAVPNNTHHLRVEGPADALARAEARWSRGACFRVRTPANVPIPPARPWDGLWMSIEMVGPQVAAVAEWAAGEPSVAATLVWYDAGFDTGETVVFRGGRIAARMRADYQTLYESQYGEPDRDWEGGPGIPEAWSGAWARSCARTERSGSCPWSAMFSAATAGSDDAVATAAG